MIVSVPDAAPRGREGGVEGVVGWDCAFKVGHMVGKVQGDGSLQVFLIKHLNSFIFFQTFFLQTSSEQLCKKKAFAFPFRPLSLLSPAHQSFVLPFLLFHTFCP